MNRVTFYYRSAAYLNKSIKRCWEIFPTCSGNQITLGVRTTCASIQYIPRNMHTVFALLCFVVVIHWLIFPYPSGLLHWHCGNLTIAPVPAKQPCWIWINTSFEFINNDCITTTKQSTTKPCAYFLGYTVYQINAEWQCIYHKRINSLRTKQFLPTVWKYLRMIFICIRWLLFSWRYSSIYPKSPNL